MRVLTQNILGQQAGWVDRRSVLVDGFRTEAGHTFMPSRCTIVEESWSHYIDRRIDYLLVRTSGDGKGPTLSVTRCERIFDEPVNDIWGSDHFGVLADFRLP